MANNRAVQLCSLGSGGVGKTALCIQFCSNIFVPDYDPTIEDSYRKVLSVEDKNYLVEILDTAGQEEFMAMRDRWIRNAEGFLIIYDITSRESFENIGRFFNQILRIKDATTVPMILLGNKLDLEDERNVSYEEGNNYAIANNCIFMETSAKARVNVVSAFEQIIEKTVNPGGVCVFPPPAKKKDKSCVLM